MGLIGSAFGPVKQAGKFFAEIGGAAMSEGGTSAMKQKASHMWSGGKDYVASRNALNKASSMLDSGAARSKVKSVINNNKESLENIGAYKDLLTDSGSITTSAKRINQQKEVLSNVVNEENFLTGPGKAATAFGGYQGYRKLRDPDHNVPMVPFI